MAKQKQLAEKNVRMRFPVRLQRIAKAWQSLTEAPLNNRVRILKSWASGYFDKGAGSTHLVNLIDRGICTLTPFLVEGNPKVLVESEIGNLRSWAYITRLAMNFFINKIKLAENVLIPAAQNSMYGAGIVRTSFVHNRGYQNDETEIRLGIPSVDVIDDSNYIGDPSASCIKDFLIEGDIYRLPTDYAKDFFPSKYADYIKPDCKLRYDHSPTDIAKKNFDRNIFSLRDFTTFIDLYLYDEDIVVTIMPEGKKAIILNTIDWGDVPGSPYDKLGYKYFPEMPIPIPPAWAWYDQDTELNFLLQKMKEQAASQKDVLAYEGSAKEDAKRVAAISTQGTAQVDDVQALKALSFGGVNPQNYQWANFIESHFATEISNLYMLGGKEAQSPTLGQEQMLMANALRYVSSMSTKFHNFMESVVRKLAWHFWTDPTVYVPVIRELPGIDNFPAVFSRAEQVGDFYDFVFKVIPYSAQRETPNVKFQKMLQFLTQWILPTLPVAAQQGVTVDFNMATKVLSDYFGIDTLNQWYRSLYPNELQNVGYKMLPTPAKGAGDRFGASYGSRMANLNQFTSSERANKSSPPQSKESELYNI